MRWSHRLKCGNAQRLRPGSPGYEPECLRADAGESGTGKELIARAIHNLGERARCPFVAVSCGAIPETLIESELFGHETAHSQALSAPGPATWSRPRRHPVARRNRRAESANSGQAAARAAAERVHAPGQRPAIPLKARVIFATHRDLQRMVSEGTFRLDLYYRINVVTIKAPALADHLEDVPVLAEFFVKQYSDLYNKRLTGLAPGALRCCKNTTGQEMCASSRTRSRWPSSAPTRT